jgi:hypothetical protein
MPNSHMLLQLVISSKPLPTSYGGAAVYAGFGMDRDFVAAEVVFASEGGRTGRPRAGETGDCHDWLISNGGMLDKKVRLGQLESLDLPAALDTAFGCGLAAAPSHGLVVVADVVNVRAGVCGGSDSARRE